MPRHGPTADVACTTCHSFGASSEHEELATTDPTPTLAGAALRVVMGVLVDHLRPRMAGIIGQVFVLIGLALAWVVGVHSFFTTGQTPVAPMPQPATSEMTPAIKSQRIFCIGVRSLLDPIGGNEHGVNFHYAMDFYPVRPLVLSFRGDLGNAGEAMVTRLRGTAGVVIGHIEVYGGWDNTWIGSGDTWQDFGGVVGGLRIWL